MKPFIPLLFLLVRLYVLRGTIFQISLLSGNNFKVNCYVFVISPSLISISEKYSQIEFSFYCIVPREHPSYRRATHSTFLYFCGLMLACSCPPQETTEKDGQVGHTPHSTSTHHPPKDQLEAELYARIVESGCSRYRQHKEKCTEMPH